MNKKASTATNAGDTARSGSASLNSRFFNDSITNRNAAAANTVLIKRINKLIPDGACGIAKKKGIENTSVIIEIIYEKFNASSENNDFFSNIVDTAEKTADKKARISQVIFQFISIKRN
jgi:hypothetical protein